MKRQKSTTYILACCALWLSGCAAPIALPKPPGAPASPFNTTTNGNTTVVAVAPPAEACCPHQTAPEFLGITQCVTATQIRCARGLACLGFLFPGLGSALEPTPPLLPITDPANLNSPDPAIKAAAEIKSEEDSAPQKIAALRYLATIGCAGCYEGVEEAFIKSMEDCTEEVRYEAVLAVRATACSCDHCDKCSGGGCRYGSCCSAKIQKKLQDLAYGTDDDGCPKESSERVRRQARLALEQCGPALAEPEAPKPEPGPKEVPKETPQEPPKEAPPADAKPAEEPAAKSEDTTAQVDRLRIGNPAAPFELINPAAGGMGATPIGTVIADQSASTEAAIPATARPNGRFYRAPAVANRAARRAL